MVNMGNQILFSGTSPEELAKLLSESVKAELQEQLKNINLQKESEWITPEETAELLNVVLSTLHRYRKKGKIIAYNFENKVYYKRSEIEAGFTKIL